MTSPGRFVNRCAKGGAMLMMLASLFACASGPEQLQPIVIGSYPHDESAFTQGLVLAEGRLFESTGLYGASSLREVDPATGEVLRIVRLPSGIFGEGLALVDDRLVMITWREETALVFDVADFAFIETLDYRGEGWGLCFDGAELWMSDGSSTITVRDPGTFGVLRTIEVTRDGEPVTRLNELECVGDSIYANVWLTDTIVRFSKADGRVDAVVDASNLLTAGERAALGSDAVLNGIAYDADRRLFHVTGKLWPRTFLVRFE